VCLCCDFHPIQGAAALIAFLVSAVFHEVRGSSFFPSPHLMRLPFYFYFLCLLFKGRELYSREVYGSPLLDNKHGSSTLIADINPIFL
jgi:hypothetical protein